MRQYKRRFRLYRYQILPLNRHALTGQLGLPFVQEAIDVAIARKNELFRESLLSLTAFRHSRGEVIHQVQGESGSVIVLGLAVRRWIVIDTDQFTDEPTVTYPDGLLVFDNDPDMQVLAIQVVHRRFPETSVVASIVQRGINDALVYHGLTCIISPIFVEQSVWGLIDAYKGQLSEITFHLITPNMSNISDRIVPELRQLAKEANAVESNLGLRSAPGVSLSIDRSQEGINGMVNYVTDGGGSVSVRGKNLKVESTGEGIREFSVSADDLEIEAKGKAAIDNLGSLIQQFVGRGRGVSGESVESE